MEEMKKPGQQTGTNQKAGQEKKWEKPQGKGCGSCCTTKPEKKEEKSMQQQQWKKPEEGK